MNNYNYGIIGNCTSAALISDKGSLDWCCLPDFGSRSFFAKILDKDIGGEFSILGIDLEKEMIPLKSWILCPDLRKTEALMYALRK